VRERGSCPPSRWRAAGWGVDRNKLDTYLDQLEEETAKWANAHPLNPRDKAGPDEDELE